MKQSTNFTNNTSFTAGLSEVRFKVLDLYCCVSIQGLHPSKDPAFEVFEGESFKETLLTSSAVVKWDGLAFGAFPGCVTRCFTLTSRFLTPRPAKVTIYPTRCLHFLSYVVLFRAHKAILGYVRPRRIVAVCPPQRRKRRPHLEEPSDWAGLQMLLRRMQTLN